MSVLIFLMGTIIGFITGATICFLLIKRKIRLENSPRQRVENFIAEFNRYYKATRRESDS